MLPLVRHHRVDVVGDTGSRGGHKAPPGEHASEVIDGVLGVGRDRQPVFIQLDRAIDVQTNGSDGEELQNLARVVLVRSDSAVSVDVEIIPHRGIERDFVQQLPIVSESVAIERLQIRSHPARLSDVEPRDHDDLMQSERDSLTQLICSVQRVHEEPVLQRIHRVVVPHARGAVRARRPVARRREQRKRRIARHRCLELLLEERLEADFTHVGDEFWRGSEGRLFEEANDVGWGRLVGGWVRNPAQQPLLVGATVGGPLNDAGAVFHRHARDVERFAAVAGDQPIVAATHCLDRPFLVVAIVRCVLDDRGCIGNRRAADVERVAAVSRHDAIAAVR